MRRDSSATGSNRIFPPNPQMTVKIRIGPTGHRERVWDPANWGHVYYLFPLVSRYTTSTAKIIYSLRWYSTQYFLPLWIVSHFSLKPVKSSCLLVKDFVLSLSRSNCVYILLHGSWFETQCVLRLLHFEEPPIKAILSIFRMVDV